MAKSDDPMRTTVRQRILFRSWHRGTQESDLLFGSFADVRLAGLDAAQLDRLEALLDCSDPDLFDWIVGITVPPRQHDNDVLDLLRVHWARQSGSSMPAARGPSWSNRQ